MAKRYYHAIKEMTEDDDWLKHEFANHPIRKGRTIEDPDFPRIAITYSLEENEDSATENQVEMKIKNSKQRSPRAGQWQGK